MDLLDIVMLSSIYVISIYVSSIFIRINSFKVRLLNFSICVVLSFALCAIGIYNSVILSLIFISVYLLVLLIVKKINKYICIYFLLISWSIYLLLIIIYNTRVFIDMENKLNFEYAFLVFEFCFMAFIVKAKGITNLDNIISNNIIGESSSNYYRFLMGILFLFLGILFLWMIFINNKITTYDYTTKIILLLFSIFIFIFFIVFSYILVLLVIKITESVLDKQYKNEVQDFLKIIRGQRHDFNFHLQAIGTLITNKSYNECECYINNVLGEAQAISEVMPLYDPAIAAMLSSFKEKAENKGIKLNIDIYYNMEDIKCTVYEINRIMGNIIQNSIEEVEFYEESCRYVQVIILKRMNRCIIKVINKFNNDPNYIKDMYKFGYSTKNNHEGIGLYTVSRILKKYNGAISTEVEDDNISMIVYIPLN